MNEREYVRERLSAYLDGELSESDRARVERAVDLDEDLAEQLRQLQATRNMIASLPREKPSDQFVIDVLARAERESLIGSARRKSNAPATTMAWTRRLAAAAVLVVTAGLGALLTYSFMTGSGGTSRVAIEQTEPNETTGIHAEKNFRGVRPDDKNGRVEGILSKLADGGGSQVGGKQADDLAGVEGDNYFGLARNEKYKEKAGKDDSREVIHGEHGQNARLANTEELRDNSLRWHDELALARENEDLLRGRRGGNYITASTNNLSIATADLNDALKDIQEVLVANGAVVVHEQQMTNDLGEQQVQLGIVMDADRASIATRQLQQVQDRQTVPQSLAIERALAAQRKAEVASKDKRTEDKLAEEGSPARIAKGDPAPARTGGAGEEPATAGPGPLADEDETRRRDSKQAPGKAQSGSAPGKAGGGQPGADDQAETEADDPRGQLASPARPTPDRPSDLDDPSPSVAGAPGGTEGQGQAGRPVAEAAPEAKTPGEPTEYAQAEAGTPAPRVAPAAPQPTTQELSPAPRDPEQKPVRQAVLVVTLTQRDRVLAEKLQKLDAVSTQPEEVQAVLDALQKVLLRQQQQLQASEAQADRAKESDPPVPEPSAAPATD